MILINYMMKIIENHFESFEQGHGVNSENLKSFLKWLEDKY